VLRQLCEERVGGAFEAVVELVLLHFLVVQLLAAVDVLALLAVETGSPSVVETSEDGLGGGRPTEGGPRWGQLHWLMPYLCLLSLWLGFRHLLDSGCGLCWCLYCFHCCVLRFRLKDCTLCFLGGQHSESGEVLLLLVHVLPHMLSWNCCAVITAIILALLGHLFGRLLLDLGLNTLLQPLP
jgi:hypothetical protein